MPEKKVMVTGCFDLLHPSHIQFLEKAAVFGRLYVSLGSDEAIHLQKQRSPTFSEQERLYMLKSLSCVHWVEIAEDPSPTGFVRHLDEVQPDYFLINEDGDTPEKETIVLERGVEYLVFPRDHFNPEIPTSTTQISGGKYIPTRVSLCSGFLDNPTVNARAGTEHSSLIVIPIEPVEALRDRSGMATSTIRTVEKYFGCLLPSRYDPETLGEMIFCLENPPHKRGYISGTLDSLGILGVGVNMFTYPSGTFFPSRRESLIDEEILLWLESHLYLKHSWERDLGLEISVDSGHPQFSQHCRMLNDASRRAWESIKNRDLNGLAVAMNQSRLAQSQIVPNHSPEELHSFIRRENALASMIMGAGGGGYVAFLNDAIPDDGQRIKIRRPSLP